MGLYEFIQLPDQEKADITWQQGTYLMMRNKDGLRINLYGVEDFYVEAWYDPEFNCIVKFQAFKSVDALVPYLDLIELSS